MFSDSLFQTIRVCPCPVNRAQHPGILGCVFRWLEPCLNPLELPDLEQKWNIGILCPWQVLSSMEFEISRAVLDVGTACFGANLFGLELPGSSIVYVILFLACEQCIPKSWGRMKKRCLATLATPVLSIPLELTASAILNSQRLSWNQGHQKSIA